MRGDGAGGDAPLHAAHEHSDEVENVLKAFGRAFQSVICKSTQEDKKVSHVLHEKL